MELRVAAIQMEVRDQVSRNAETICRAIREASAAGAAVLLTPEGALSGYTWTFDSDEVTRGLDEVTSLARECGVGLALGTCLEESDGKIYNELRFYTPDGDFLGFHSKVLRCGTLTKPRDGEVERFATTRLRTFVLEGIPIGGLVCNDMWANPACTPMPDPHLSQRLSRMGARIVFHAVNGGRNGSEWSTAVNWPYHEANLRMRARAGRLWIVSVDSCSPPELPCASPSGVIGPDGTWQCRANDRGERFFAHTIRGL